MNQGREDSASSGSGSALGQQTKIESTQLVAAAAAPQDHSHSLSLTSPAPTALSEERDVHMGGNLPVQSRKRKTMEGGGELPDSLAADDESRAKKAKTPQELQAGSGVQEMKPSDRRKKKKCKVADCSAEFKSVGALARHHRVHTNKDEFECTEDGCDATFALIGAVGAHVRRAHPGERRFKCDFTGCGASFIQSGHLVDHKVRHTGEKPHVCAVEECSSAFTRASSLKRHERLHKGERPYKCDFTGCNSAFTQSSNLTSHRRKHTGERPYKCEKKACGAAFRSSGGLTYHRRSHQKRITVVATGHSKAQTGGAGASGSTEQQGDQAESLSMLAAALIATEKLVKNPGKKIACDEEGCESEFSTTEGLLDHTISHKATTTKEEAILKCDFVGGASPCTASFQQAEELAEHRWQHEPRKCDKVGCNAEYTSPAAFKDHVLMHDDMPYKCETEPCGVAFKTLSSLAQHRKIHTGGPAYKCHHTGCSHAFNQMSKLSHHLLSHVK